MEEPTGTALVGLGYWGPALLRNFEAAPDAAVLHLVDRDLGRAQDAAKRMGSAAKCHDAIDPVLEDPAVVAVVLATPVRTHYRLAKRCLSAGRHVLVEKPLGMTVAECRELEALAEARGLCLLVGHTFRFNPAVERIKTIIDGGGLGRVLYVHGRRVNLGRIQADFNALWSFAPHDFSILNHWLDATPISVAARGFSYIQEGIEDVVFCTVRYPRGIGAHLHLGWLDPRKVREMTVVGTEKMVVLDDVVAQGKVRLFDRSVTPIGASPNSFTDWQLDIRHGDVTFPAIDWHEPLRAEVDEFLAAVREQRPPRVPPSEGTAVTAAIVAAQESLQRGGQEVLLEEILSQS